MIGALSKAVPERVSADTGGTSCNFLFGGTHPDTDRYYVHYHFDGVGWGGRANADGNSNQVIPNGNCPSTPVEIFETRYPFLERSYRLRQDSGGAGTQRGGLGSERILEVRAPEITVSALFDRMVSGAWGLFGGEDGQQSALLVKRVGHDTFVTFREAYATASNSRVANIVLKEGDQVMLASPGGGGYGDPRARAPEAVRRDVMEGFVSEMAGRDVYGVALQRLNGTLTIDVDETARLRADAPTPAPPTITDETRDIVSAVPRSETGGHWEQLKADWWQTDVTNCQLCGQVIPRDVWVSASGIRFCSVECDDRHHDYWLPRQADQVIEQTI